VECQVGLHAQGDGLRAKPTRGDHLSAGNGGNALLVGVYVDDLVITGTKDAEVAAFKEEMKATFQMSDLGLLSFYLGIEVHQGDSGITPRQTTYVKRVVELAGLTDCNPALTPMAERLKLSRNSTTEEVDATQYWRLVGSLRYLVHTRSDLAFSVGYVSRFMQRPTTEHQRGSSAMLRGLSTITSTTRGALGRHTLSGTATATTPVASTLARPRAGSSSSSTSVSLPGSRSSSRWWPCPVVRLST
jgi:hypothetical protein